jgi:hypothetical protein
MVTETLRFMVVYVLFSIVLVSVTALLTGCSELKYVECIARDNTRNPCQ